MAETTPEKETIKLTGDELGQMIILSHRAGFQAGQQASADYITICQLTGPIPRADLYFRNQEAKSLLAISDALKRSQTE